MKTPYLSELCRICGHLGIDHEYRNFVSFSLEDICWECASNGPFQDEIINVYCYHKFKFGNLDYLQKLYAEKQKLK